MAKRHAAPKDPILAAELEAVAEERRKRERDRTGDGLVAEVEPNSSGYLYPGRPTGRRVPPSGNSAPWGVLTVDRLRSEFRPSSRS